MLSDGRAQRRPAFALAVFIVGVCWLSFVGAFVTVRAFWGWIT
jgi:hypothetical protein